MNYIHNLFKTLIINKYNKIINYQIVTTVIVVAIIIINNFTAFFIISFIDHVSICDFLFDCLMFYIVMLMTAATVVNSGIININYFIVWCFYWISHISISLLILFFNWSFLQNYF